MAEREFTLHVPPDLADLVGDALMAGLLSHDSVETAGLCGHLSTGELHVWLVQGKRMRRGRVARALRWLNR